MTYAVLFPGQGSQVVGMGADLFDEHSDLLGRRSDEILGWSLRELCLNGPEEELTRTEHAQPALFALSYGAWLSFASREVPKPSAGAGHSLGEYTALAASNSINFEDCLRLVALRGRLMAEAADASPSGMAALLGAEIEVAEDVVAANRTEGGTLEIANINAPGQIVVAGSTEDLAWLAGHGKEHGVRRSMPLKVAGGFHSSFMDQAREGLSAELETVSFGEPDFPVWANVTARPHETGSIAQRLTEQVTSTVRFGDILTGMAESGVTTFIHIGPGDVTAGLARRTVPESTVVSVSRIDEIEPVTDGLVTMVPPEVSE